MSSVLRQGRTRLLPAKKRQSLAGPPGQRAWLASALACCPHLISSAKQVCHMTIASFSDMPHGRKVMHVRAQIRAKKEPAASGAWLLRTTTAQKIMRNLVG